MSDGEKALAGTKRVARPGATVGFHVWDYPGGGVEVVRAFWNAAASLDPAARPRLKETLQASLPRREDGSIALKVRAWAVRAAVP